MTNKIKRSEFATFIKTATSPSTVWSRLGDGVRDASIEYNPNVTDEQYIHQNNGTKTVEGYAPVMSVEAVCKEGDAVFAYIDAMRKNRAILADAETEILNVWLYETPTSTDQYPCEKQAVAISFDSFGGEGGVANQINFTINYIGDPVVGVYDVSEGTFT